MFLQLRLEFGFRVTQGLGYVGRLQLSEEYKRSSQKYTLFKVVVCGHCLVALSLTINKTLKWLSSLHACPIAGVIVAVTV